MKKLQLPLIYQWFSLTRKGIKGEDYRYITPNYCSKLLLYNGKKMSREFWRNLMNATGDIYRCDNSKCNVIKNDCENLGNAYNVNDFAVIIHKHLNQ